MLHKKIFLLYALKKQKNLTFKQLSISCGMNEQKIKRIFSGKQQITIDEYDLLLNALSRKSALIDEITDKLHLLSSNALKIINELTNELIKR